MESLLLAATLGAAGCGEGGAPGGAAMAARAGEEDMLRVRHDPARGRVWVLGLDDVRIFDAASKRLVRQVMLPGWSVARHVCSPDLALDASGSATVSSNVQPRLWRIDGGTFEVKEQVVSLLKRERWDIGFGALGFAADGSLYAVTANAASLWKIDLASAKGSLIEIHHPPLKACAVTPLATRRAGEGRKP